MRKKKLIWQIYPANLCIMLLVVITVTWYGSSAIRKFHQQQTAHNLEARAILAKGQVLRYMASGDMAGLGQYCRETGKQAATRITVTDAKGLVLADSDKDPALMENHGNRPEIMAALTHRIEPTIRFSATLQTPMMYVAIPLTRKEYTIGTLRTAMEMVAINQTLEGIRTRIGFTALLAALLAGLISWGIARRISRPLEEMRFGAEKFAQGNLSRQLALEGSEETAGLARALNHMARELDQRIRTILRQHNELEAVFSSMMEGVLVIDSQECFVRVNKAGARLLDSDPEDIPGKNIIEIVRNLDLINLVRHTLAEPIPIEGEVAITRPGGTFFYQINGVRFHDQAGRVSGCLLVLNDVTRIRRLEKIRRDFVANVSHELRTPITAIKGFVETLLDGAMNEPEHAGKFLGIIAKKTERLNNLVDDLLALSRIEQQTEKEILPLAKERVILPLKAAISNCREKAKAKDIAIQLHCPDDLPADMNGPLLEQAVLNLLENAIKYSPVGTEVIIEAERQESVILIRVRDNGQGIPAAHLHRIFERFYRVDDARGGSNEGGTGLGLAIVKHIAQAHGGDVQVKSSLGKGSEFTIIFPAEA